MERIAGTKQRCARSTGVPRTGKQVESSNICKIKVCDSNDARSNDQSKPSSIPLFGAAPASAAGPDFSSAVPCGAGLSSC